MSDNTELRQAVQEILKLHTQLNAPAQQLLLNDVSAGYREMFNRAVTAGVAKAPEPFVPQPGMSVKQAKEARKTYFQDLEQATTSFWNNSKVSDPYRQELYSRPVNYSGLADEYDRANVSGPITEGQYNGIQSLRGVKTFSDAQKLLASSFYAPIAYMGAENEMRSKDFFETFNSGLARVANSFHVYHPEQSSNGAFFLLNRAYAGSKQSNRLNGAMGMSGNVSLDLIMGQEGDMSDDARATGTNDFFSSIMVNRQYGGYDGKYSTDAPEQFLTLNNLYSQYGSLFGRDGQLNRFSTKPQGLDWAPVSLHRDELQQMHDSGYMDRFGRYSEVAAEPINSGLPAVHLLGEYNLLDQPGASIQSLGNIPAQTKNFELLYGHLQAAFRDSVSPAMEIYPHTPTEASWLERVREALPSGPGRNRGGQDIMGVETGLYSPNGRIINRAGMIQDFSKEPGEGLRQVFVGRNDIFGESQGHADLRNALNDPSTVANKDLRRSVQLLRNSLQNVKKIYEKGQTARVGGNALSSNSQEFDAQAGSLETEQAEAGLSGDRYDIGPEDEFGRGSNTIEDPTWSMQDVSAQAAAYGSVPLGSKVTSEESGGGIGTYMESTPGGKVPVQIETGWRLRQLGQGTTDNSARIFAGYTGRGDKRKPKYRSIAGEKYAPLREAYQQQLNDYLHANGSVGPNGQLQMRGDLPELAYSIPDGYHQIEQIRIGGKPSPYSMVAPNRPGGYSIANADAERYEEIRRVEDAPGGGTIKKERIKGFTTESAINEHGDTERDAIFDPLLGMESTGDPQADVLKYGLRSQIYAGTTKGALKKAREAGYGHSAEDYKELSEATARFRASRGDGGDAETWDAASEEGYDAWSMGMDPEDADQTVPMPERDNHPVDPTPRANTTANAQANRFNPVMTMRSGDPLSVDHNAIIARMHGRGISTAEGAFVRSDWEYEDPAYLRQTLKGRQLAADMANKTKLGAMLHENAHQAFNKLPSGMQKAWESAFNTNQRRSPNSLLTKDFPRYNPDGTPMLDAQGRQVRGATPREEFAAVAAAVGIDPSLLDYDQQMKSQVVGFFKGLGNSKFANVFKGKVQELSANGLGEAHDIDLNLGGPQAEMVEHLPDLPNDANPMSQDDINAFFENGGFAGDPGDPGDAGNGGNGGPPRSGNGGSVNEGDAHGPKAKRLTNNNWREMSNMSFAQTVHFNAHWTESGKYMPFGWNGSKKGGILGKGEMLNGQWHMVTEVGGQKHETLNGNMTTRALQGSEEAWGFASGNLNMNDDPRTMVTQIINRGKKYLNDYFDKVETELKATGVSATEARELKNKMRTVADASLNADVDKISAAVFGNVKMAGEARGLAAKTNDLQTPEALQDAISRNPRLAAWVQQNGGAEAVQAGQYRNFIDDQGGEVFGVGNAPQKQWNNNRQNGFGRTPWFAISRAVYGGMMASRIIGQTMGAEFAEAEQYGAYQSSFTPFQTFAGESALEGETGFSARSRIGRRNADRGAYQEFGGIVDMMNAGASNPVLSRLAASARVGGGIALGGLEAGIGLGFMGGFGGTAAASGAAGIAGSAGTLAELGALATPIMAGGAIIGGGVFAGTVGFEAYNSLTKPKIPMSWGDLAKQAGQQVFDQVYSLSQGKINLSPPMTNWGKQENSKLLEEIRYSNPELYNALNREDHTAPIVAQAQKAAANIEALTGESPDQTAPSLQALNRNLKDNSRFERTSTQMAQIAKTLGISTGQNISDVDQMAQNLGYTPGTAEYQSFVERQSPHTSTAQRAEAMFESQRVGQYGSQVQQYFSEMNVGKTMVRLLGMKTAPQVGAFTSAVAQSQQWGGSEATSFAVGQMSLTMAPALSNMVSGAANNMAAYGFDYSASYMGIGSQNFGAKDLTFLNRITQGDFKSASKASREGMLGGMYSGAGYQMFDVSGNPISETSGKGFYDWLSGQAGQGNVVAGQILGSNMYSGSKSMDAWAKDIFGTDERMKKAYLEKGTQGMQFERMQQEYETQMASIGIQGRGIALQQNYLWGNGTYDNPSSGSSWGLENQTRALGIRSTRADFAQQQTQMTTQNNFAIQGEAINWDRMQTSYANQVWNQGINYTQFGMQKAWAKEDYQYQDTTRNLNFGWSMEDFNEQIRMSSGRQRRLLVRQRDRAVTSFDLEGEQIDKTRDRQGQSWALEEERFKKQKEFTDEMMELDVRNFNLNKTQRETMFDLEQKNWARKLSEFEEQKKLEDQQIDLSRKYQKDQMDLQLASLGVQAKAAEEAHTYQLEMEKIAVQNKNAIGEAEQNVDRLLKPIKDAMDKATVTSAYSFSELTGMLDSTKGVQVAVIDKLITMFQVIGTLNPNQLKILIDNLK